MARFIRGKRKVVTVSHSDENRNSRRDKKRDKRRHGQRGGTGKRSKLIQDIWVERAEKIKRKRESQQPTDK